MILLILALMTLVAATSVVAPLLARHSDKGGARDDSIDFYKTQIAEIDRDLSTGLFAPAEAESARAEAARRLLRASKLAAAPARHKRCNTGLAAFALFAFIILFPGLLYYKLGQPDTPDAPLAERLNNPAPANDLASALARIESHLAANPEDGRGWEVVAPVYLKMGRLDDAKKAFGEALRINGENADRQANYGEALVAVADGAITPEARKAFERALELAPKMPKARYYMGLAAEQDGETARAAKIWTGLADDSPPNSPLTLSLRRRVAQLTGKETAQPEAPKTLTDNSRGAAIATMNAPEREAAIKTMVDGLAAKLKEKPNDLEGWLRLMRAYSVLKEDAKAKTALSDARKAFAENPAATARVNNLAAELGLEG